MVVSGFTIVRNAIQYDYPIREAIESILPLCDEVVVAVGRSDDDTLDLVRSIPGNIRILETEWDESLREGGRVLADETNKALKAISGDTDWAIYIQGDEVMHEDGHQAVRASMEEWLDDPRVEGLVYDYRHFYGSYDFIGDSHRWYRREVRTIRRDPATYSFRDAQGFQKEGRPLRVKEVAAHIHHYGWVKHPSAQQAKQQSFNKLWHDDEWMASNVAQVNEFDYGQVDSLARFEGTHPKVMQARIDAMNWKFSFDPTQKKLSLKHKLKMGVEKMTGWNPGEYRNYKVI